MRHPIHPPSDSSPAVAGGYVASSLRHFPFTALISQNFVTGKYVFPAKRFSCVTYCTAITPWLWRCSMLLVIRDLCSSRSVSRLFPKQEKFHISKAVLFPNAAWKSRSPDQIELPEPEPSLISPDLCARIHSLPRLRSILVSGCQLSQMMRQIRGALT